LPAHRLQEVYPDPAGLFGTWLKPLSEVATECYVVLDTNVLLTPYTIGPRSLDLIRQTYAALIAADRLRVPAQVAREFVKNRAQKLEELFSQLSRKQASMPKMSSGRYPLLEPIAAYKRVGELEHALDQQQQEYRKAVSELIEHVRGWTWNDPVSSLYSDVFSAGVILDPAIDRDRLATEHKRRMELRIPPGYKDVSKSDGGIGDLLIWLSILELGRESKRHVLFVSGDEKSDWWHRSEGQTLYPRFELAEEYKRLSDGGSFHIARFSTFLDLFGVEEKVVAEVRQEEREARNPADSSFREFRRRMEVATRAVAEWAKGRFGAAEMTLDAPRAPDLLIVDEDDENVGIEVFGIQASRNIMMSIHRLREVVYRGHWYREKFNLTIFGVAMVAPDESVAIETLALLKSRPLDVPTVHIYVGYLTESGDFAEIEELRF
jgi:hypothetical protein